MRLIACVSRQQPPPSSEEKSTVQGRARERERESRSDEQNTYGTRSTGRKQMPDRPLIDFGWREAVRHKRSGAIVTEAPTCSVLFLKRYGLLKLEASFEYG
jgi:hypothetical protein